MQGAVFRCEGLHPLTRSGAGIEARNFLTPHAGKTLSLMEKKTCFAILFKKYDTPICDTETSRPRRFATRQEAEAFLKVFEPDGRKRRSFRIEEFTI
jgi:hypothetical protein